MIDAIDRHFDNILVRIHQNKEQRKTLKAEYTALKDALNESLFDLTSIVEGWTIQQKKQAANCIYWSMPDIRPSWLVLAFFDYKGKPVEFIDPVGIPLKCSECGRTFIDYIEVGNDNRHNYFRYKETNDLYYLQRLHCHDICPSCQNRQAKEFQTRQDQLKLEDTVAHKRLDELKSMPYAKYLQTPEWNKRRKRAYKRARYKCQLCGAKNKGLNAHHNSKEAYTRRGEEWDSDLIVLCNDCNASFHKDGKRLGVK